MPASPLFPLFVVRNGVTVVCVCALLDHLFGADGWFGKDPAETGSAVAAWLNANSAHYHAWEGPSWHRLAEENDAVAAAVSASKGIVVIEALS